MAVCSIGSLLLVGQQKDTHAWGGGSINMMVSRFNAKTISVLLNA